MQNSLYPYIAITEEFPVGKYEILLRNDIVNRVKWDKNGITVGGRPFTGLAQCQILAPKSGFFARYPFLQMRSEDKSLRAILCKQCSDKNSTAPCVHSEKERSFCATFTACELNFSLKHGYKILAIFEMLHYKEKAMVLAPFVRALLRRKAIHEAPDMSLSMDKYCAVLNESMGLTGGPMALSSGCRF